jgi:hypothetical protein
MATKTDTNSFGSPYNYSGMNYFNPAPEFWNTQSAGSSGDLTGANSGLGQGGFVSNVDGGTGPLNSQQEADYLSKQSFGPWSGRADDLYSMLMQRAQQGLNVNPKDEIIRNQVDSFGANEERSRRNYLNEVAEQAGPIANTSAERRSSAEKVAQDTAGFQAQLMGRELEARRNEIAQALFMMGSLLTDEQRMNLQRQLALLENALGKDTLAERSREFDINNQNTLAGL